MARFRAEARDTMCLVMVKRFVLTGYVEAISHAAGPFNSLTSTYYREYDPDQYYSKFNVHKDADRGHWREERFIRDRISAGYYFEITHDDG